MITLWSMNKAAVGFDVVSLSSFLSHLPGRHRRLLMRSYSRFKCHDRLQPRVSHLKRLRLDPSWHRWGLTLTSASSFSFYALACWKQNRWEQWDDTLLFEYKSQCFQPHQFSVNNFSYLFFFTLNHSRITGHLQIRPKSKSKFKCDKCFFQLVQDKLLLSM